MEWLGIVNNVLSALGALAVLVVPWLGRRLSDRAEELRQAEDTATRIAEGLKFLEAAVASRKAEGESDNAGAAITSAIKNYGPSAIAVVDKARELAHQLAEESWKEQEERILARERADHEQLLAERAVNY